MKAYATKKDETSPKGAYKKIMSKIEFMEPYLHDPEIFNMNSTKFKDFLIQSFAHLHSDFHYLSFLNKEDIDQEIVKVAGILQILPMNPNKKTTKLFDNLSETDIHKFWLRFFTLFDDKKLDEFNVDSIFNIDLNEKIDFLKDINSTVNYLHYDFPIVNLKNLTNVNMNKEIEKWDEQATECDIPFDDSVCYSYDTEPVNNEVVEKLITDLKHIVNTYKDIQPVNNVNKSDYCDFFSNFINLVKSILKYRSDLSVIDSFLLDDLYSQMLSKGEHDSSRNLYFIKRCNNLIKILKSKIRAIE